MIDIPWSVLQPVLESLGSILGLGRDPQDVDSGQMALRAIIVYVFALVLVRIASKRLLAQATAFDVVVAILLGSVLSRAINGSAPFVPTILAGAALVALHWLFATTAVRTSFFGRLVKGERRLLIEDGRIQEDQMRQAKLSDRDLEQALHARSLLGPSRVKRAWLERDGTISIVPFEKEPRVVDVEAQAGTQTIRIKIE